MPHQQKEGPVAPVTGPSRNVDPHHRIDHTHETSSTDAALMLAKWLRSVQAGRGLFRLIEVVDGRCSCRNPDCSQAGKHPAERWGTSATLTERAVAVKFRLHPDAGIGLATGRGLLVLDFDAGRGGIESLRQLDRLFPTLRDAPRVLTGKAAGSRGRHVYLRVPDGVFVPSRANVSPEFKGVDVRCAGGYVVAPGSPHRSGVIYEWEHAAADLPSVPDQLLALLTERETKKERGGADRQRSRRPLSARMSAYLRDGIPLDAENGQRGVICALARALLELPVPVDVASDQIWESVQRSEWSREPWTEEMVFEIVADIDRSDRPGLRKQQKQVGRAYQRRER